MPILAYYGHVRYTYYPTSTASTAFLADINPHFGVWRYPNRGARQRTPCFNVTYTSNSYGARDIERTRDAPDGRRVVVLGDSFVEGIGSSFDERMTTLIEQDSGIELLNFGMGGFGPIQEWLLYKELASAFDHSEVYLFILRPTILPTMSRATFRRSAIGRTCERMTRAPLRFTTRLPLRNGSSEKSCVPGNA